MPESQPESPSGRGVLSSLMAELRRRRVNRVAGLYLMGALAVVSYGSDILGNLGAPPELARWLTLLVIAGFPVAVAASWVYDIRLQREQESPPGTPALSGARGGVILASGILLGMGLLGMVAVWSRPEAAAPVRAAAAIPLDSLATTLGTDYLVSPRVRSDATETRLTIQVVEASGTVVHPAEMFVAGPPSLAAAEELTRLARDHVLRTVGAKVRAERWRVGTESDVAFNLLYQADDLVREAKSAMELKDGERAAGGLLADADHLLLRSMEADPAWAAPRLLRANVAHLRAYALLPGEAPDAEIARALGEGVAIVDWLLQRDSLNAQALYTRGMLRHRTVLYLDLESAAREELLRLAAQDLSAALRIDANLAAAAAELSHLRHGTADFADARIWAERALLVDGYQLDAPNITHAP